MEMMKRQLLLFFFIGLLAAVHSSPVGAVSHIAKPEKNMLNEAKTEGFLVNEQTGPSKTNTTSQAPQLSDAIREGSGETQSSEQSEGSGQNPIGTSAVTTQDTLHTTESDEVPETPGTPQTTQRPHLESMTEASGEITPSERLEGSEQNPIGTSAVTTQETLHTNESDEAPETPGTPQTTQRPHLESMTEASGEITPSEQLEGSEQNPIGTSAVTTQETLHTNESDEVPETPGTPQTTQRPHLESMTEASGEITPSERLEGSEQNPIGTSAVTTQETLHTNESDEAPETPGTPQTTQRPHLESMTEASGEITPSEQLEGSEQNPIGTSAVTTQETLHTNESDEAPETPGTPQTTQRPHLESMTEASGESTPSLPFDGISETRAVSITSVLPEDSPSDSSTIQTTHSRLTDQPELKFDKSVILKGELPPQKAITDDRHLDSSESKTTSKTTHSRADWLIILGIAVGIVALLGLCVAVATRDKWNKDSSSGSVEKSNLLNQEREQEMQTFLHKNKPKENGQIGEYTVIPLNDIPEKYFSN
ncbi:mucin-4 isoform X2 [Oryzias latipes]|uniref:mucin-4 isoform X2 n=1 Tax=Oryzias latipes TaxID=8090 RepID=UPI000CE1FFF2|nr:mucin-4 isoform X2 [Oryzias latipes]